MTKHERRRTLPGRWSSESQFQAAVAKYLDIVLDPEHAIWTHIPSGGKRSPVTAAMLKRHGVKRGWPDVLILWTGHWGMIELKAHHGSLTADQLDIAAWVQRHGFHYLCCKTLADVERALMRMGVPTRIANAP